MRAGGRVVRVREGVQEWSEGKEAAPRDSTSGEEGGQRDNLRFTQKLGLWLWQHYKSSNDVFCLLEH